MLTVKLTKTRSPQPQGLGISSDFEHNILGIDLGLFADLSTTI